MQDTTAPPGTCLTDCVIALVFLEFMVLVAWFGLSLTPLAAVVGLDVLAVLSALLVALYLTGKLASERAKAETERSAASDGTARLPRPAALDA